RLQRECGLVEGSLLGPCIGLVGDRHLEPERVPAVSRERAARDEPLLLRNIADDHCSALEFLLQHLAGEMRHLGGETVCLSLVGLPGDGEKDAGYCVFLFLCVRCAPETMPPVLLSEKREDMISSIGNSDG